MKTITTTIDFGTISTHADVVNQISPVFEATEGDSVRLVLRMRPRFMLLSDHLLMVVSTVYYLRSIGVVVSGLFEGLDNGNAMIKYASRVNFFRHLNFPYNEDFERRESSGRFTEISLFEHHNANSLHIEIMKILINQDISTPMLEVLETCLWEVIDNTLNHSHESFEYGTGKGFLCCQHFFRKNKVRVMISDNGQGIHKAMLNHPKSTHKEITEANAVLRSIERGFTNGGGQGFGLWATAEMVRQNRGSLIIHSGNSQLYIENSTGIRTTNRWQGTFTFMELNTDVPVDHKMIFGQASDRAALHAEFKEGVLAGLEQIW